MIYGRTGGDVAKLWGQSSGNWPPEGEVTFTSQRHAAVVRFDGACQSGSSNSPDRSQAGLSSVQKSMANRSRT
jgi:hypothetical protein